MLGKNLNGSLEVLPMKTCDTQVFVEVTEQIKLNNNQHQTDYSPQVLKEFKEERAESVPGPSSISQPTVVTHGLESNSASF